jgi:hypothetical protein
LDSSASGNAVRFLCIPEFYRTGQVILVDINSSTLEPKVIDFSVMLEDEMTDKMSQDSVMET